MSNQRRRTHSQETKEKIAQALIDTKKKTNITSKLELKVEEELIQRNIPYIAQFRIESCIFDFLIGEKILLEIFGNYWS